MIKSYMAWVVVILLVLWAIARQILMVFGAFDVFGPIGGYCVLALVIAFEMWGGYVALTKRKA